MLLVRCHFFFVGLCLGGPVRRRAAELLLIIRSISALSFLISQEFEELSGRCRVTPPYLQPRPLHFTSHTDVSDKTSCPAHLASQSCLPSFSFSFYKVEVNVNVSITKLRYLEIRHTESSVLNHLMIAGETLTLL